MKTYQYDNTGEILLELGNIKRLLEVIAGVKPLKEYQDEEECRKSLEDDIIHPDYLYNNEKDY